MLQLLRFRLGKQLRKFSDVPKIPLEPFYKPNGRGLLPSSEPTAGVCSQAGKTSPRPREKRLDSLAMQLANLCGFNDGKDFYITGESIEFKPDGKTVNSEVDVYCVRRCGGGGQLVLWEDKLSSKRGTKLDTVLLQDSVAQVIGEMISVHCQNKLGEFPPTGVYAIRLIGDMVAFFKMEMTEQQIVDVCEKGVVPDPKPMVHFTPRHVMDPGEEYGVSLLTPENRLWFVRMMACIRNDMLKHPVPAVAAAEDTGSWKRCEF